MKLTTEITDLFEEIENLLDDDDGAGGAFSRAESQAEEAESSASCVNDEISNAESDLNDARNYAEQASSEAYSAKEAAQDGYNMLEQARVKLDELRLMLNELRTGFTAQSYECAVRINFNQDGSAYAVPMKLTPAKEEASNGSDNVPGTNDDGGPDCDDGPEGVTEESTATA